jgi:hypothetical protein
MKLFISKKPVMTKGQSFIELALVFMILMLIFAGVVELGNLINVYLDIIDAGREASRNANTYEFYNIDESTVPPTITVGDLVFNEAAKIAWNTMNTNCQGILQDKGTQLIPPGCNMRIPFDPLVDDIVISVMSYDGHSLIRFPDSSGWSRFNNEISTVTDAQILSHLDSSTPSTGIIMVEVFYNYHQLLGMPFFTDVLPDPIPVHTFSIMPYPSADPTPTPIP